VHGWELLLSLFGSSAVQHYTRPMGEKLNKNHRDISGWGGSGRVNQQNLNVEDKLLAVCRQVLLKERSHLLSGDRLCRDRHFHVCGLGRFHQFQRKRENMRIRAVIIDDEPLMRQLLEDVCEMRGYEVFTFPDPGKFPLHASNRCPCPSGTVCADIVISDLRMPNVNGLDFLDGLVRKGCRNLHYALISGHWTEAAASRAKQLGCKVFGKPFDIRDITQWLEEVEALIAPERELFNWNKTEQIINPTEPA
jgi:CheY-like chemotaxis protein